MQILQGVYLGAVAGHGANAERRGVRRGKRGNARNVVANRSAADGFFVVKRFAAERRVDQQIDLAGLDQVDDIRAPFVYFVNRFASDSRAARAPRRFRAWR